MKTVKITLFSALLFFAASCKKDEVKPTTTSLDNATLSLASESQIVTPPTGLANSKDQYAMQAASYINSINGMTSYLSYMKAPSNAVKSNTQIVAKNGRVATAGDSETWTWSDSQGNSVGYQISETTDSYVFDIFLKSSGTADWLKYFHAEEKKDKSSGLMYILDIFGIEGSNTSAKLFDYTWSLSGTSFKFKMTSDFEDFEIDLTYDTKTKAGEVVYYIDSEKWYDMKWDTNGNGSWTVYDTSDGTVEDSGTWTV